MVGLINGCYLFRIILIVIGIMCVNTLFIIKWYEVVITKASEPYLGNYGSHALCVYMHILMLFVFQSISNTKKEVNSHHVMTISISNEFFN